MSNNKAFIAKNGISTGDGYAMPDVRPSLLLDFANSKTLDPRITFTRGSTATYWDGKTTTKAEENLLKYSQDLGNANTPFTNVEALNTILSTSTAPDGTSTASSLIPTTAGGVTHRMYTGSISGVTGNSQTYTFYAKAAGFNYVGAFLNGPDKGVLFNLSNGTASDTEFSPYTGSTFDITSVGNGWYRCRMTATGGSVNNVQLQVWDNTPQQYYAGNNSDGVLIWGVQLESRSSATTYTPTTSQAIVKYQPTLQTAASGEARFDHDPVTGESKGLLIEESRTNEADTGQDFTNASWVKSNVSVTGNVGVAPNGSQVADLAIPSTATTVHQLYDATGFSANQAVTSSVFAKLYGGTVYQLRLNMSDNTTGNAFGEFDLVNGTTGGLSSSGSWSNLSAQIENVGNGWYRCSLTATKGSGTIILDGIDFLDTGQSSSFAGDGFSGLLLWGKQLELGSFPTSYIATSGSTVTRSRDEPNVTDLSWFNNQEGSFSMEGATLPSLITTAYYSWWSIEGDPSGSENRLIFYNNNRLYYQSPASTYSAVGSVPRDGTFFKASGSFKYGDSISAPASFDGVSAAFTGTNGPQALQPDILRIGRSRSNLLPVSGHIKKLAFFTKQFSQATLNAMTEE